MRFPELRSRLLRPTGLPALPPLPPLPLPPLPPALALELEFELEFEFILRMMNNYHKNFTVLFYSKNAFNFIHNLSIAEIVNKMF
jgi:hypothetical protein